jgi:hypothetical protein
MAIALGDWLAENVPEVSPGLSFIFDALGPEKTRRVQEMLVQQLQDDFRVADVCLPNEGLIAFAEKWRLGLHRDELHSNSGHWL